MESASKSLAPGVVVPSSRNGSHEPKSRQDQTRYFGNRRELNVKLMPIRGVVKGKMATTHVIEKSARIQADVRKVGKRRISSLRNSPCGARAKEQVLFIPRLQDARFLPEAKSWPTTLPTAMSHSLGSRYFGVFGTMERS